MLQRVKGPIVLDEVAYREMAAVSNDAKPIHAPLNYAQFGRKAPMDSKEMEGESGSMKTLTPQEPQQDDEDTLTYSELPPPTVKHTAYKWHSEVDRMLQGDDRTYERVSHLDAAESQWIDYDNITLESEPTTHQYLLFCPFVGGFAIITKSWCR
jgi:hypothetical protein